MRFGPSPEQVMRRRAAEAGLGHSPGRQPHLIARWRRVRERGSYHEEKRMAEHTVTASSIAENEEEHERGALYVEKETGHHYMMARVSLTDYALIHIATGNRHADATSEDPFAGERGDFRRIPGNRKITIE